MPHRLSHRDGQLCVAGLRGWQSNAGQETGFDRVRFTGKPVVSVSGLKVARNGVTLTFTPPLDTSIAEDTGNWSGSPWNYKRTGHYGSPKVSVSDPARNGTDPLDITAAMLSADGRTVTLSIADVKPVMQQLLAFKLKTADGAAVNQQVLHTINALP